MRGKGGIGGKGLFTSWPGNWVCVSFGKVFVVRLYSFLFKSSFHESVSPYCQAQGNILLSRKSYHSSENVSLVLLIDAASIDTTATRDIFDTAVLFYFRTMESLYEELVHEGILVRAPRIRLSEYAGEYR